MSKFVLALLLVFMVSSVAMADDAIVLPKGVFRLRAVPSYSTAAQAYDGSGALQATNPNGSVMAMSGAFELGLVDPLTLGVQWAPGYFVSSTLTNPTGLAAMGTGKLINTGMADLQIGAKLEVLGSQGLIQNENARFAVTVGGIVPLDSYDAQAEWNNYTGSKDFRAASTSSFQSYGFGAKADADYKINKMFFVNLHGEAKYYLANDSLSFTTIATHYGTIAALAPSLGLVNAAAYANANVPLTSTKTQPGLVTIFELEPHAAIPLGGPASLNLGLPLTYNMNLAGTETYNSKDTTIDATSILSIGPNASLFTTIGPLPVEFEVQYQLPLMGVLENATSTISFQLKIFGKVY
jgi:hypothetical protein